MIALTNEKIMEELAKVRVVGLVVKTKGAGVKLTQVSPPTDPGFVKRLHQQLVPRQSFFSTTSYTSENSSPVLSKPSSRGEKVPPKRTDKFPQS